MSKSERLTSLKKKKKKSIKLILKRLGAEVYLFKLKHGTKSLYHRVLFVVLY